VALVHDHGAPRFQWDVRSALPIDASERDGPRRDRTNGLTLFGREVDTSVQAMPIVARLAQTADRDSRVAI